MPAAADDRWLGATSIHTRDYAASARSALRGLLDLHPPLHLVVNHFDAGDISATRRAEVEDRHPRISVTWVADMKGLFWKRVLTPERLRGVRVIWLFDADVAAHPAAMPLGGLVSALLSTDASAMQPQVRALGMGTDHSWLRQRPSLSSCVASTARFVEVMTPLLQADAWIAFHEQVLSRVPDGALALSDFGIDVTWCAFFADVFPQRPACLVLYSAAAVHANSNSIRRFMNASTISQERACAGTCRYLRRNYPRYYMNFSHDTQDCWAASNLGLVRAGGPRSAPRYVDAHGFWKAGRRGRDGHVVTATGKRVDGESGKGKGEAKGASKAKG